MCFCQHQLCSVPVLNGRRVNDNANQETQHVNHDMAFESLDFFFRRRNRSSRRFHPL